MKIMKFEWDKKKATVNIKKHGVSFEEAQTAFHDEYAIQFFDPDHSENEDRYILLGASLKLKTLIVCHCYREEETVIRIISARKADNDETHAYWSKRT
ncbi:MAG TPA: BrnT family toxin [Thiothrix sp.]|nr:BrnT family toxin [Thiothrix sp.]